VNFACDNARSYWCSFGSPLRSVPEDDPGYLSVIEILAPILKVRPELFVGLAELRFLVERKSRVFALARHPEKATPRERLLE
jgi:hypothetical protein